uniref:Uncharacterized protein n=1 Tax=Oryza glumipatula TaxID=40148 RepID=A0A0E0BCN3_9ORYZ
MPLRLRAAPARAWLTCVVWAASTLLTTMFVWKVAALMLWPVVAVVWGLSVVTALDMRRWSALDDGEKRTTTLYADPHVSCIQKIEKSRGGRAEGTEERGTGAPVAGRWRRRRPNAFPSAALESPELRRRHADDRPWASRRASGWRRMRAARAAAAARPAHPNLGRSGPISASRSGDRSGPSIRAAQPIGRWVCITVLPRSVTYKPEYQ